MEGEEWLIMGVVSARCRPGRGRGRGWGGSVLSIHDPWCYTLSCNTCNLSRHPLSRAVCGAVRAGAGAGAVGGGGGRTARIHSQVMNWNQPPKCHVYCLGSSMVRHCSRGQGRQNVWAVESYGARRTFRAALDDTSTSLAPALAPPAM